MSSPLSSSEMRISGEKDSAPFAPHEETDAKRCPFSESLHPSCVVPQPWVQLRRREAKPFLGTSPAHSQVLDHCGPSCFEGLMPRSRQPATPQVEKPSWPTPL